MESHHFNFLNEEDVRKQLNIVQPTLKEKVLSEVKAAAPAYARNDLETKKKSFKPQPCPDWAKLENSTVIWDNHKDCSLAIAAKRLKINLSGKPVWYYKPSLLDNWLFYENGYIARHNEGGAEIRKYNGPKHASP